ncbi:OLC1v1011427C1 [Oldenlandia corymbosa var. corymbosa]|uniref:OLC1v1011427C1 n=1 Tax=Oldenlandia corymbosa var. corymbosa TaxID=529605 RepID=A0AAV1DTU7_OLDCO|nr:OLC1v1011427C1 [Oldenlandia corymbosa var. corymbosa]
MNSLICQSFVMLGTSIGICRVVSETLAAGESKKILGTNDRFSDGNASLKFLVYDYAPVWNNCVIVQYEPGKMTAYVVSFDWVSVAFGEVSKIFSMENSVLSKGHRKQELALYEMNGDMGELAYVFDHLLRVNERALLISCPYSKMSCVGSKFTVKGTTVVNLSRLIGTMNMNYRCLVVQNDPTVAPLILNFLWQQLMIVDVFEDPVPTARSALCPAKSLLWQLPKPNLAPSLDAAGTTKKGVSRTELLPMISRLTLTNSCLFAFDPGGSTDSLLSDCDEMPYMFGSHMLWSVWDEEATCFRGGTSLFGGRTAAMTGIIETNFIWLIAWHN